MPRHYSSSDPLALGFYLSALIVSASLPVNENYGGFSEGRQRYENKMLEWKTEEIRKNAEKRDKRLSLEQEKLENKLKEYNERISELRKQIEEDRFRFKNL